MPRKARSAAARPAAEAEKGLSLHSATERVAALLRERTQLLRKVAQKKRALERETQAAERAATVFARDLSPLLAQHQSLTLELHALFRGLLRNSRISRRVKSQIAQVFGTLSEAGWFEGLDEDDEDMDPEPRSGPAGSAERGGRQGRFDSGFFDPSDGQRDVAAAPQRGQQAAHEGLREAFRRLARSLHPDRTQDESEKARRTQLMKEVTRAYEEGDLARLLELERAWMAEGGGAAPADGTTRAEALERANTELRAQLRALSRELKERQRAAKAGQFSDVESAVDQAKRELTRLQSIFEHVKAFRDGKITIQELLAGPPSLRQELEDDFDEFLEQFFEEEFEPRRSSGGRRR